MEYLVTGATGFVGNNAVRRLLELNQSVRVLIRKTSDRRTLEGLSVDIFEGDVTDIESVHRAMKGVDVVIHAAANLHIGWKNFASCRQTNIDGTQNVASVARENGARMVHVSSVDALSAATKDTEIDEDSPVVTKLDCTYVVTKQEAESVFRQEIEKGLHGVIVNPGFMLGPWDWKPSSGRMLISVAKGAGLFAPSGGMSVCDVRDVVDATIKAADRGASGQRYILGGHNITYLDAWREFAKQTGARSPLCAFGPIVQFVIGSGGDLFAAITGKEPELNSAMMKLSSKFHYYNSGRAERELDYRIRPMDESIADAWAWFREHGYT